MRKLKEYCDSKGITLVGLGEMTGVALSTIYYIDSDSDREVKNSTMKAIMHATNNKFGEPLMPWEYLDGWINPIE